MSALLPNGTRVLVRTSRGEELGSILEADYRGTEGVLFGYEVRLDGGNCVVIITTEEAAASQALGTVPEGAAGPASV